MVLLDIIIWGGLIVVGVLIGLFFARKIVGKIHDPEKMVRATKVERRSERVSNELGEASLLRAVNAHGGEKRG